MTSTSRILRSTLPGEEGPAWSPTDHVRSAIAARAQRLAAECPAAVDLVSRALVAMRRPLAGLAAQVCGTQQPEHFRESLRGERVVTLDTLCRLATQPTKEPREAVRAALGVLAGAIGCYLEPLPAEVADQSAALAQEIEASAALSAELARDLGDGRIDSGEVLRLEPLAQRAGSALASVEAVIASARHRLRVRA